MAELTQNSLLQNVSKSIAQISGEDWAILYLKFGHAILWYIGKYCVTKLKKWTGETDDDCAERLSQKIAICGVFVSDF